MTDPLTDTKDGELLAGCSAAVRAEYLRHAGRMRVVLSDGEFQSWAGYGARLGAGPGAASQTALEYFKASAVLVERWPFQYLPEWAATGERLARSSAQAGAAYFRASPEVLAHLRAGEVALWGTTCERLLSGGWQSGALAAQLFEMSPDLLRFLDLSELGLLADLLLKVAGSWYPAARQCLALAVELLPDMPPAERQRVLGIGLALADRNGNEACEWLARAGALLGGLDDTSRMPLLVLATALAHGGGDAPAITGFIRHAGDRLGSLESEDQARFLSYAGRIAGVSAQAADDFLRSSATLAGRVAGNRLDAWVGEGMDALREGESAGRAYFRLESTRSMAQLRELSPAVELSSVAELLRLYCTALTGQQLQVQPTSHLVHRGIGWTAEQRPTTEGNAIFLPDVVQVHQSRRQNFERLKVYALHQSGHLEFGSFRFEFDKDGAVYPTKRGELAASATDTAPHIVPISLPAIVSAPLLSASDSQELPTPLPNPPPQGGRGLLDGAPPQGGRGVLETDLERFFQLFHQRRLAQDIFTLTEDARIDARSEHEYAGIRVSLQAMQKEERSSRAATDTMPPRTALLEALLHRCLDRDVPSHVARGLERHLDAAWSFVLPLLAPAATVEDAAEATLRLYLLVLTLPLAGDEAGDAAGGLGMPVEELLDELGLQSSPGHSMGDLFSRLDTKEEDGGYEPIDPVDYRGDFKPQLVQTMMKLKEQDLSSGHANPTPISMEELQRLLQSLNEVEITELSDASDGATSGLFVTNLLRESGRLTAEEPPGNGFRTKQPQAEGPLTKRAPNEYLYDEWDFRAGSYRPDWCLLRERTLEPGSAEYYDSVLARHAGLARTVRRQFQALRPELFKKIKNLTDGEEYDLDAVIASAVDRRAHISPSEKVYWRRNKIERNVAVALLLDVSASTDEDAKKEARPHEDWHDWDQDSDKFLMMLRERLRQQEVARRNRRRIIDVERESAVLLIQALEALGDSYGVYGFSGYGRDGVELFVVKELGEAFGETVKARVGNLEPVRGTRMGAAIRHVITKLEAREARTRLLLLVSDGRPQDHDYGRDRTERDYALHDTRKALLEAKQKHIVPFALTVDREGHDYLRTICAGIGYEVVDDIEALPTRLPAIYRELAF